MTLVHNYQVKEIRAKQSLKLFNGIFIFRIVVISRVARKLLIEGEIDLVSGNSAGVVFGEIDFMGSLFQWREILLDGLVYQIVSIR